MAERIMEIIIYVISSTKGRDNFSDTNLKELEKLGYTKSEISTAFSWIVEKTEAMKIPGSGPFLVETKGFRVLIDIEQDLFTTEAFGDLIQFNTLGLINNEQLELLIDRTIFSHIPIIDRSLLRSFVVALNFDNPPNANFAGRMLLEGNDTIN